MRPSCMSLLACTGEACVRLIRARSAANDFWGKRFLALSGEKKMTQKLAIATGCAAGATESFVVVPFELVKIKCVYAEYNRPLRF